MEKEIDLDRDNVAKYTMICMIGICLIFTLFFGIGLLAALIYGVLIAPWLTPMQAQAIRYRLDDKTLRVDEGVFFLSRKAIPLDRITDLAMVQGPVMRFLDIWALRVQTSGTGTPMPEATLYGIRNPEQVREEILAARDAYLNSRRHVV